MAAGASGIALLLGAGRPPAVSWLVVAVVVDPVNGIVGRRAAAHVGQEVGEGVAPPLADGNPTTAIVRKPRSGWAVATADHRTPAVPLWRQAPGNGTRPPAGGGFFALKATAGLNVSRSQVMGKDDLFVAAVAATEPALNGDSSVRASGGFDPSQNNQPTEPLSREVTGRYPWGSHVAALLRQCLVRPRPALATLVGAV